MPAKTITIQQVTSKSGLNKKGRPYTKWGIKDQEDEWFNTFRDTQGKLAQDYEGTEAVFEIGYETGDFGNDLTSIAGPVSNDSEKVAQAEKKPEKKATKSAENPETQRSIAAAVALDKAVATLAHTVKVDATAKDAADKIEPLANSYFNWLVSKAQIARDEDLPF